MRSSTNFKKNLFTLIIGLLLAFILAEVIIRIFPDKFFHLYTDETYTYQEDKELGYLHVPNQASPYNQACYRIYPVKTNSLGFRDREHDQGGRAEIAILGDSFMDGLGISEGDYLPAILEKLLNQRVVNLGVAGYGTVTQLIVYRKFVKPLKPNLVILFFEFNTDIVDNSCELSEIYSGAIERPCGYLEDGRVKIVSDFHFLRKPPSQRQRSRLKKIIKKYCLSCTIINRIIFDRFVLRILRGQMPNPYFWNWDVYVDHKERSWEESWEITRIALSTLKKEVESEGAEFIVVAIPGHIMTSKTWKREELYRFKGLRKLPQGFDNLYPLQRLRDICRKEKILLFDPLPDFLKYRDKFNLEYPYFSFWCDGHWNPVAHFLSSNLVARYLIEKNYLPLKTKNEEKQLLKKIKFNLNLSPLAILGKDAYRQIYEHRVYQGKTKIGEILKNER